MTPEPPVGGAFVQLIETETPHAFTVAEYMSLDIATRTELLAGVVYDVSPRKEPHRLAVRNLSRILTYGLFDSPYVVQVQDAVAVPDWEGGDAPEVDVAVIAAKRYRPGPTSVDALAFIEVADTTYARDRGYKIPLYVRAGVPSWIVNIPLRQVECYESLDDLKPAHGRVLREGETLTILGVALAVADLFEPLDPASSPDLKQ
jgi:hypothetical protein